MLSMAQVIRVSDEVYEQLKAEASASDMSMAALASTRLATHSNTLVASVDTDTTTATHGVSRETQSGQGTLWSEQQARLDEQEQRIKELTAATISNRYGILELAGDDAKRVNEMMQGAYEELLEQDMPDIALELEGFIDG
jgi:hypothetical protein